MRTMKLILLIAMAILAGCAIVSVDDRLDLAMECEQDCDLLWEEYNTAAEQADRRRAKLAAGDCGRGMILYCNRWCTATRTNKNEGVCVPQNSIFSPYY